LEGKLADVETGKALTLVPHASVMTFQLLARFQLQEVRELSDTQVEVIGCQTDSDEPKSSRRSRDVPTTIGKAEQPKETRFVLEDRDGEEGPDVHVVSVGPKKWAEHWRLVSVAFNAQDDWKEQLRQLVGNTVVFEAPFEVRHVADECGVQRFRIQPVLEEDLETTSAAAKKLGVSSTASLSSMGVGLQLAVPVVSVSWIHKHQEVLALKIRGLEVKTSRESGGSCVAEFSAQHLQVDHFMESEMPVMLNRRFLHINSRWLGKKALSGRARWTMANRMIEFVELELVPYWMNIEIGVLIRLWELAEGSFKNLRGKSYWSSARPLEKPQVPRPISEDKETSELHQIWRLLKLSVRPVRLTVHVRSPDIEAVTDNATARWIMRLPADMPNMDMTLPTTVLHDRYGSLLQLCGVLQEKYKRRMKFSFTISIIVSYLAAIVKALVNAIMWLGRGPFDSVLVAYQQSRQVVGAGGEPQPRSFLWWVSPLIYGTAEGTYRGLAELVGNTAFGIVFFLNTFRHIAVGTARPRIQSILDGLAFGFRGFFMDTLITPFSQSYFQTQTAYQDWGAITACVIFVLSVLRVPFGSLFGLMNLIACSLEGLANVLLHEEAQFANFEPQRITEPLPSKSSWLSAQTSQHQARLSQGVDEKEQRQYRAGTDSGSSTHWFSWRRPWKTVQHVTRAMMDDDQVMDMVAKRTQNVFDPDME